MALEPVAGQVYFSPECHAAYAALGFSPSPGSLPNGVQFPDGAAYFTSRGSVMGQVPGEVVAAAFAVFNPEAVIPAVGFGWTRSTPRPSVRRGRKVRSGNWSAVLGPEPEGLADATELLDGAVSRRAPRASRCARGCRASACRAIRWATCGGWRTRSANTAATPTRRPGPRPVSTPPRSGCSPSSIGDCPCAPTSAPGPGPTSSSRRPRTGSTARPRRRRCLHDRGQGSARGGRGGNRRPVRNRPRRTGGRVRCAARHPHPVGRRLSALPVRTPRRARTTWLLFAERQTSGRCSVPSPGVTNSAIPGSWTRAVCQTLAGLIMASPGRSSIT